MASTIVLYWKHTSSQQNSDALDRAAAKHSVQSGTVCKLWLEAESGGSFRIANPQLSRAVRDIVRARRSARLLR
jgi:hypothetical protein